MTDENCNGENSRVKQAIDVLLQHHLHTLLMKTSWNLE